MIKRIIVKCLSMAVVGTLILAPASVFAGRDKKPTSISRISSTSKTVNVGQKFELKVFTKERNVEDDYFVWSSSNEDVVDIWDDEETGDDMEFKALSAGTATITCQIEGTNISKTCTVTVKAQQSSTIYVKDEDDFEVEMGEVEKINAYIRKGKKKDRNLNYKSLTPDIVTVDKKGRVFGVNEGVGEIEISSKADPSIKTILKVNVEYDD